MNSPVPLFFADMSKDAALVGAQTNKEIWTPTAGKRIVVTSIAFTVSAEATVQIFRETNAAGNRFFNQKFDALSGTSLAYIPPFLCGVDEVIKVTTDAGNINITMTGFEI